MSYLSAIALLLSVLSPLLVPLTVGGIRGIANWPRITNAFVRLFAARVVP